MDEAGEHDDQAEEFLRALGGRIRQFRKARKLSQEKLAFAADLTQHYLSQIEKGERNVSVITIRALAKALGVAIAELFQGIE